MPDKNLPGVIAPHSMRRFAPLLAAAAVAGAAFCAAATAAVVDIAATDADGRALAGTVVFLESPAASAAVRPMPAYEIGQQARQFQPQVNVVTVGTQVRFPNRDTVRHHVYSFSPAKPFELKLYSGVEAMPIGFDQAGLVVLGCNIHDGMVAWLLVVATPYHAVSGADGRIRLDVPAGGYRLRSWHHSLPVGAPPLDQALSVAASGASASVRVAAK